MFVDPSLNGSMLFSMLQKNTKWNPENNTMPDSEVLEMESNLKTSIDELKEAQVTR